jgi:LuxR family maltose regulon positive regulatory protein
MLVPNNIDEFIVAMKADAAGAGAPRGAYVGVAALALVDPLSGELAGLLLATAQPSDAAEPSARTAESLELLTILQRAGWITRSQGRSSAPAEWRWNAQPRTALRAALNASNPALARQLNEIAGDWYSGHRAPAKALQHFVFAHSWSRFVELVESRWAELLFRHPGILARALRSPPASAIAGRPKIMAIRDLLAVTPPMRVPFPPMLSDAERAAAGRSAQAREAMELSLAAMVALRRRGRYAQALGYSEQLEAIRGAAARGRSLDATGLASFALTQRAILSALLGRSGESIELFREAFRAAPSSTFEFCMADAVARLALSYARTGQLPQAGEWLDLQTDGPGSANLLARRIPAVTNLAQATIAVFQLDRDRAEQALDRLGAALDDDEYWPFVIATRASYTVTWSDPAGIESFLSVVRDRAADLAGQRPVARANGGAATTPVAGPSAGIAAAILTGAQANLLLALGRGNEAQLVLDGRRHRHPLLDEPWARLALLAGDNDRARDLALIAGERAMVRSPLQRLEMMLVVAVASHRLGRGPQASDALRRAVHEAKALTVLAPFARLPRAELLEIAATVPEAQTLLGADRLVRVARPEAPVVRLVTLSKREQLILGRLAQGDAAAQIAATLNVSINTVRSQRRSLYRKLGVASRVQALRVAAELGLLG